MASIFAYFSCKMQFIHPRRSLRKALRARQHLFLEPFMSFSARFSSIVQGLALTLLGVPFATASAQDYPSRPITIVVPFATGGGVDIMARILAEKLRAALGQAVIVDNKPGASGMLGAGAVVKAAPDGYTVLLGSAGETAINPKVYKARMPYQPTRDLAPITLVARVPNLLVASRLQN
jgi:tripartite-type tricarboxylate transporter receptor subunit TctC